MFGQTKGDVKGSDPHIQDAADVAKSNLSPSELQQKSTVILLSGFMAPWYSMLLVQRYLRWKGWPKVEIFNYNSRSGTIEKHGQKLAEYVKALVESRPEDTFHFYCTSMGNLVLRCAYQSKDMPDSAKRGRHVNVAPPWRGVAWGRLMDRWAIARWISGDGCGKQLRETPMDGFDSMGDHPPGVDVLVITGSSSWNPFIAAPNDGTIVWDETILKTPHWRTNIVWGMHSFMNMTPAVFWLSHNWLLGTTDGLGLDFHPGLDALKDKKTS